MKAKFFLPIFLATTVLIMPSCKEEKNIKKFIVGQWSFDRFKFSEESGYTKDQQLGFDNSNKGFILEFLNNGKLNSTQIKNGKIIKSLSVSYQILPDDQHIVIDKDTSEVVEINGSYLKLFHQNRPEAIFRRDN
jgi:hypothetical protein